MASLSTAKMLGGIGAILIFIPFVSVIGYILIIVAVKSISDDLQDKTVFNNVVIAAVAGIVGAFVAGFIVIGVIASFSGLASSAFSPGDVGRAIGGGLAALFVAWIALIVSAVFIRRAYGTMAQRLSVGTFRTAGTLYLVGAATTIILVGFLLLFIAEIIQAVAYFSIPDQVPGQPGPGPTPGMAQPPPPMAAAGGATKFCVNCGNRLAAAAVYCNSCGAKQP